MLTGRTFHKEMIYIYFMKNRNYKRILYFIGTVILITLCIQVYWNYRNYQTGKQQLINEVQISLDKAVEQYYASRAQRRTRNILQNLEKETGDINFTFIETQHGVDANKNYVYLKPDTFKNSEGTKFSPEKLNDIERIQVFGLNAKQDLDSLVGKILFSMRLDTLNMPKLDSLVLTELKRKEIDVNYGLLYTGAGQGNQSINPAVLNEVTLQTQSKSPWLPQNSNLTLYFHNETATILKANLVGLLLSTLLMTAVIGCLLFLLKIINDQKQLAEIKNDLISNITHEFKTPISTIRVAMEGILNFNSGNDPEKAKNYARTSSDQIEKLNHMVEKLLETATLTGNQLYMEKEELNPAPVLETLVQKYRALAPNKSLKFESSGEEIKISADPFHIENAFSNILDNAVKYGGDEISVWLRSENGKVFIHFRDNANSLMKAEVGQIFDKFYRVPKGNTHDVKGFGIGLYYTKQIIERHGGSIKAEVNKQTTFTVELPL